MMSRSITWPYRPLMCLGWMVVTAISLLLTSIISGELYRSWPDSVWFIVIAPLWLAVWEFPLVCTLFVKAGCPLPRSLGKGLLWSLAIAAIALLGMPPLVLVYLILTPYGFVLFEVMAGVLQSLLLRPFVAHPFRWALMRAIAVLIGMVIGWQYADGPLSSQLYALPSPAAATLMGLVGGLIKGVGLMYYVVPTIRHRPPD